MNDDKTIVSLSAHSGKNEEADHTVILQPSLKVGLLDEDNHLLKEYVFANDFTIGRSPDNDIVLSNKIISRRHIEIKKENGWWIYDLNSANGVYIENERVNKKAQLNLPARLTLGKSGISLKIESDNQNYAEASNSIIQSKELASRAKTQTRSFAQDYGDEELKARLLSKSDAEDFGEYTRLVRKIIHEDRMVHGKSYKRVIQLLSILFLISAVLIVYQQVSLSNARGLAIDMFYDIKTLEVNLSQAEIRLAESAEVLNLTMQAIINRKLEIDQRRIAAEQRKIEAERELIEKKRQKLNEMKNRYKEYVDKAQAFKFTFFNKTQYEDDLIVKVARGFGESELEIPQGFIVEVKRYISYWQQSSRIHQAMAHLEAHGYPSIIIDALSKEGLPLYFAYLPLQESDYDAKAIGPVTRFGIAKGAWQFLPATGQEYGLMPGPLANKQVYDKDDERFDFEQATRAGAKYLKYLFSTEAQASGLLVLASYNYGHTRIKQLLNQMPDNPREKNFWNLIQHFELPEETYDYVLYVFSAAVIGEDPLHFGFGFKPLFN